MFLVNSRQALFAAAPSRFGGELLHATRSTPSPEVTGSFCRVPSGRFSRAPEDTLPAYLCRFWYGHPKVSPRGFSRRTFGLHRLYKSDLAHTQSRGAADLPTATPDAGNGDGQRPASPTVRVPPWFNDHSGGAGILTCYPSPTPFSLGLGTG